MPMSSRRPTPPEDRSIATIHAALDAGVTLLDTADIYAPSWDTMGHNEAIVGRALASWSGDRDTVVVATKGGITRSAEVPWGRDGSRAYLRTALERSRRALDVDVVDLYQWHRPDRRLLFSDVIATFVELRDEGRIRAIGLSNVNVEEIELAAELLGEGGLASVQNEFSPSHTASFDELTACAEQGIAFLPWSPLGGIGSQQNVTGRRFEVFEQIGRERGVSPHQVVLAWELALGTTVIPIPGASRPESVLDSVLAADLSLDDSELDRCNVACGPPLPDRLAAEPA